MEHSVPDAALRKRMEDAKEDQQCYLRTVEAFRAYATAATATMSWRRAQFGKLSAKHTQLLGFDTQEQIFQPHAAAITANAEFFETMCRESQELFFSYWPFGQVVRDAGSPPTSLDMDKVFSTLRQLVRDYSDEGRAERDSVYSPIKQKLFELFPNREERAAVTVLCPGSGLNRLPLDLAVEGFTAQGNEFSYHMLIAGHFLMNHSSGRHEFSIFPYADNTCNLWRREDQFKEVRLPDACAADIMEDLRSQGLAFGDLSMIAGDFAEVYAKPEQQQQWAVVASCFFLDTAHNIIEYLEIAFGCLRPGGHLINIGPLLYHFADAYNDDSSSIELSYEEVIRVAQRIGFDVVEQRSLDCMYTNNCMSMKQMIYRCAFFVLRKPLVDAAGSGGSAKDASGADGSGGGPPMPLT